MKQTFEFNIDTTKLQKEFEENMIQKFRLMCDAAVKNYCREAVYGGDGRVINTEGPGRTVVREFIAERLNSRSMNERMAAIVEENFEAILKECMLDAMRHQIRKTNFNAIAAKTKEAL